MIGYYVHHHGVGHVTRACQIARHLQSPVTGFSSLPRPSSWQGEWVQLPDDLSDAPEDPTAGGVLHWAPLRHEGHSARMALLSQHLQRLDLMMVDVSVEVSLLARLHGVPTVVLAMRGDRSDPAHRLAYDSATSLLVPWSAGFPEPWWPDRWTDKARFVGAISRFDETPPPTVHLDDAQPRVLVLLGEGGHDMPADMLANAANSAADWAWTLRSAEAPSPDVWLDLHLSDIVVCHGGNNAVAEVAAARRPAIVVAQDRPFREQHHTAAALEESEICVGLAGWPADEEWPGLLNLALERGTSGWSAWNPRDGAKQAALHLDGLAKEMAT